MLKHSTILRVCINNLISPGNGVCRRTFARKPSFAVKPLNVMNANVEKRKRKRDIAPWRNMEGMEKLPRETLQELVNLEESFEPDASALGDSYLEYKGEVKAMKLKFRRDKSARYNFREERAQQREISVLTWAEKENIRHLHESDPEQWTPESIAASFPITPTGVIKLLKSKFAPSTPEQVARHDQLVQDRIDRIKAGKIEMTPEIREKMALRESIPFQVGLMPTNTKEVSYVEEEVKPMGSFARIVASPKHIREADEKYERFSSEKLQEQRKDIDNLFYKQMAKLRVKSTDKLTLSEFEDKLQKSSPETKSALKDKIPEFKYLLELDYIKKHEPTEVSEIVQESAAAASKNEFVRTRISKYKDQPNEDEQQGVGVLKVDQGTPYIFDHKTGYQKPFAADIVSHIDIPEDKRVEGATYRVGDSYYDDNGEFLYRAV